MEPVRGWDKKLQIPFIFLLISGVYTFSFSLQHIVKSTYYFSFVQLAYGRALTPFQYRILIPWLARTFEPIFESLPFIGNLNGIRTLFEFAFVFAVLIVFYYFSPSLITEKTLSLSDKNLIRWMSVWLLMFTLPFSYIISSQVYYYPSDIPGILFIILGLIFLRQKKWLAYYAVFILGTFNRETICFLALVYLLTNWKTSPKIKLFVHLLIQFLLWVGIKYYLWRVYLDNTSESLWYADIFGVFKNSWAFNIKILSDPMNYPDILSIYGYLWIPLLLLWKFISDPWLKSAMWVLPLFHVAMLIPGEINEMRIYGEMLPLVILGIVAGLTQGRFIKNYSNIENQI